MLVFNSIPEFAVAFASSQDAFIKNLIRVPENATAADREDLEALFRERTYPGLPINRIQAIDACISEIQEDCRSRMT